MLERFTSAARAVVMRSKDEARDLGHASVSNEHLVLALLSPGAHGVATDLAYQVLTAAGLSHSDVRDQVIQLAGSPTRLLSEADAAALATIGIDLDVVLERVEESFGPGALASKPGRVGFSKDAKTVLALAVREAMRHKSNHIATEHLLLGLLRQRIGIAGAILDSAQAPPAELRSRIEAAMREAA